jgi:hypothetical protein
MTWLLALQIYLFSCIPALLFFIHSIYYDVMCYKGKRKPDHKFGYNWQREHPFSMCQIMIVAMLIPVVNLYTGWFMMGWVVWDGVADKFRK